ncbi:DUF6456 domain-containing protein [Roseovarius sp. SCSIO 43702]|uniref:DUF6456 domain-containing protein n=1 Tax=Roseovarius sp. SCSIO 43702 TaxID=2823043 RepID=UPI002175BFD6|nr:DUF6456 domain-containing protein [Roseovarius sp. SCSIO 43702]
MPSWVPEQARLYLEHTETGAPIRALARARGYHASTVLRRIRVYEARRDDLLVDQALTRLGRDLGLRGLAGSPAKETSMMVMSGEHTEKDEGLSKAQLEREGLRLLRRLMEPGAVLAVAAGMEKAVVVRETEAGTQARKAVAERTVAEAMALSGWIACDAPGRISRYRITREGRAELGRLMARVESAAMGACPSDGEPDWTGDAEETARGAVQAGRSAAGETPLVALARRRDKAGRPFLSPDLVQAGERLREDFELAHLGPQGVTMDWTRLMTGRIDGTAERGAGGCGYTSDGARARVEAALADLGPGLGDIALGCCCRQEGLETAEKRMGWSARSGKIVLRIALQRLRRFYDALGDEAGLIG